MYYFCAVNIHEKYIKRCIELAKNGLGTTYPNPLVGAVVVVDNKIVGEGWHKKAGESHAEVLAINAVKDKTLLSKATIYVSLEPCCHVGKTPPCAQLIVKSGIKKVVVGAIDSFEKVSGKGIEYLRKNGCDVSVGVLKSQCEKLNKRFFTFHQKKRPYIILKWAETADGFLDKGRKENDVKKPNWISNKFSQQLVQKMRGEEQAILVGTNTALNDNPRLTVRGLPNRSPVRVVVDRELKIPKSYNLNDATIKTIFLTSQRIENNGRNIFYEQIDFNGNVPKQICDVLYKHQVQSVIIEGGATTLNSFIKRNLWDEAYIFKSSSVVFKEGLKAPDLTKTQFKTKNVLNDDLHIYKNDS